MVATAHLLLYSSPPPRNLGRISTSGSPSPNPTISFPSSTTNPHFLLLPKSDIAHKLQSAFSGGGSGYGGGGGSGFINPWSGSEDGYNDDEQRAFFKVLGYVGRVLSGWFFRWIVTGDFQFPFALLIKELVGGTVFFVLERLWTQLSMEGFLNGIGECIAMVLLLPLFPFFMFFMMVAMIEATVAGIASLFLSAFAVSLFATSLYGLYCVIDWMWAGHW